MIDFTRRTLLKSTGAFGLATFATGLPVWARAQDARLQEAPEIFVNVSSALTGIDAGTLRPKVSQDGVQSADEYYTIMTLGSVIIWGQVQVEYEKLVLEGKSPAEIGHAMLVDKAGKPRADEVGTCARLIFLMWLFGIWYGKTEIDADLFPGAEVFINYQTDMVVSARAYKNGWIWRIARAHPMGFSNFGFGSWADVPPPLDAFLKTSET